MAAIDQKAGGAEPGFRRVFVEAEGDIDRLTPVLRRLNIDFDYAGIRRHLDHLDTGIERWRVALDVHLYLHFFGGRLQRGDELEIVLELFDRRHEGAQHAVADFDRHRRA